MKPEFSITTDLAGQTRLPGPLFAAFRAASFTAVHWCQHWIGEPVFYSAEYAQQVRQLADHHGLHVADVHGYGGTDGGITYTDELFAAMNINRAEFAARVGASVVVLHLPVQRVESVADAIDSSRARLAAIQPAFEKLGVRAAIENLPWPTHADAFFDALLGEFGPDFLGFCYDSGHAVIGNQAHLLSRHIDRLVVTHLHDNDGSSDQHRLPGEGKANWPEIIRTVKQSRYQGTLNLELKLPATAELEAFCRQAYATLAGSWGENC